MTEAPAIHQALAIILADPDTQASLGPAMRALNSRQQAFVLALLNSPDNNATRAAAEAGYVGANINIHASRLRHHPGVQAAITEEAERSLHGAKLMATKVLIDIAADPTKKPPDRLKAAGMVLDRVGMAAKTEHHVVVDHRMSERELIDEITALAKQIGMDPTKVLGSVGVKQITLDAEFVEVKPPAPPGLEDIW